MSEEVYKNFIDWLNTSWFGLPESVHLLPAVKAAYTPQEAELLTGFPWKGIFLEDLVEIKGTTTGALQPTLDAIAAKGLIWRSLKEGRSRYSLNDAFFVFMRSLYWSTDKSDAARQAAGPLTRYYSDGFMDQFAHAHTKGLRTLPIEKTIGDSRVIVPYEDVVKVVENRQYYTVSDCPCRSRKALDPESEVCDMPMEVCLHFDDLGRYIVQNGLGREITKEETFAVLKESADAGLVHALSNWQQHPDTICNCCSCCCLFLEAFHKLNHHKSHDPSNYVVVIQPETCKACGLCVDRCPMDALALEANEKATNKKGLAPNLNPDLCLGCGVCVHKCPTDSLSLVQKQETTDPPYTLRDWMQHYTKDKQTGPKYKNKWRP